MKREVDVPEQEAIAEKVIDIVCDRLGVERDKIKPDTSFVNDLGADSLDIVELVMEFEEEFGMSIPDDKAEEIQTIGEAIKYIQENQGESDA
ncbi:MAG: acyl carrier protein [Planctomycetes bacterium]|nr:acyl carrier protein [Planctomycetota bacterium]